MVKAKKRLTIGLQINNLIHDYPKPIFKGVSDMAEELDVNLIVFRGESPNTPSGYGYQCNIVYDLIHPNYIDALIITSGTICNFISLKEFKAFISRFKPIPLVSISIPIPGVPSLLIDNAKGIRESVKHLVKYHKRKKIAFLKGPKSNPEAIIRYKAFCDELDNCSLGVDEKLVYCGNWSEWSGKDAIIEFLDKRKVEFDALISSNDDMAIGAMKELTSRGIELPYQISIMGFDDIQDCEYSIPALSTVKQPLYQQGRLAMKCAYDLLQGKKVPDRIVLPTKPVLRTSCGCIDLLFKKTNGKCVNIEADINEIIIMSDDLVPVKQEIFDIVKKLIDISTKKSKPDHDETLKYISRTITSQLKTGKDITIWKSIFNVLNSYIAGTNSPCKSAVKKIIEDSLIIVRELFYSREVSNRITVERSIINTRTSVLEITAAISTEELCNKIIENVKVFGLKGCYIFNFDRIYEHKKNMVWKMPEKVMLFLAYNEKINLNVNTAKDYYFSPYEFIPKKLYDSSKSHIFLVSPNYYLLDQYGYIIYDMSIKDGYVYDFITMAISSTLRSVLLLMERKAAEMKLRKVLSELESSNQKLASLSETDELTGLFNRRGFIRFANQQISLARQIQQNGILLYIDMDGLKKINDKYGHDAGDAALKLAAEIFKIVFRKMDIIGRIGGDEFVVFMINTDEYTMKIILKRLYNIINDKNKSADKVFNLSLTVGETLFNYEEDISIFDLMERADRAMYDMKKEKATGENR